MSSTVVHQDLPLSLPLFITVVNFQKVASKCWFDPDPVFTLKQLIEACESVTLEPLNHCTSQLSNAITTK